MATTVITAAEVFGEYDHEHCAAAVSRVGGGVYAVVYTSPAWLPDRRGSETFGEYETALAKAAEWADAVSSMHGAVTEALASVRQGG